MLLLGVGSRGDPIDVVVGMVWWRGLDEGGDDGREVVCAGGNISGMF